MCDDITAVMTPMWFIHFSVLISNMANTNRYNSHKPKLLEVLSGYKTKGVLTPKCLRIPNLVLLSHGAGNSSVALPKGGHGSLAQTQFEGLILL